VFGSVYASVLRLRWLELLYARQVWLCDMGAHVFRKKLGNANVGKENPELVTGGPYVYVRHPIYTGVIFGMLGTALVVSPAVSLSLHAELYILPMRQSRKKNCYLKSFPASIPNIKREQNAHPVFVLNFILLQFVKRFSNSHFDIGEYPTWHYIKTVF